MSRHSAKGRGREGGLLAAETNYTGLSVFDIVVMDVADGQYVFSRPGGAQVAALPVVGERRSEPHKRVGELATPITRSLPG